MASWASPPEVGHRVAVAGAAAAVVSAGAAAAAGGSPGGGYHGYDSPGCGGIRALHGGGNGGGGSGGGGFGHSSPPRGSPRGAGHMRSPGINRKSPMAMRSPCAKMR
jgi:hypothetical protein